MALNLGLVARCLNTAHIRGMGKYVFELIKQSENHSDIDWQLFADDPSQPMTVPANARVTQDVFEFKGDRFYLWEQLGLPLRALKNNIDILHCTESTLPLWQPKPTVVTVHDTLMWDEPIEGKIAHSYLHKLMPIALDKCAAVITISESSKNDILKKWPKLASKLTVIPHGIAEEYFDDDLPAIPQSVQAGIGHSPYIVYLGGPMERKRFDWALNVMAHTPHKSLKLVACGFGSDARDRARANLPVELANTVHFAEFLSDAELLALYKNAQAVFYPTLYEGFGFPAIEAQAAGVPVVFSALGSLAELIGPLSMVVPAFDLEAWLNAVDQILSLGEQRIEKAKAARAWAKNFTWSNSCEKHLDVYRQVARQSKLIK